MEAELEWKATTTTRDSTFCRW